MVLSADNNWLQFASWAILFTSTAEELNWKVCSLTVAVFVLTPKVCSASGNQFTFDLALCIINTRIIQNMDFLPKWNEWTSVFTPRQAPPKLLRNSCLMGDSAPLRRAVVGVHTDGASSRWLLCRLLRCPVCLVVWLLAHLHCTLKVALRQSLMSDPDAT